jgi:hypothetical protein
MIYPTFVNRAAVSSPRGAVDRGSIVIARGREVGNESTRRSEVEDAPT